MTRLALRQLELAEDFPREWHSLGKGRPIATQPVPSGAKLQPIAGRLRMTGTLVERTL